MHKLVRAALICAVTGSTLASLVGPAVAASPTARDKAGAAHRPDNRPGPLTARQNALRKEAQRLILSGQRAPDEDGVIEVAADKYFEAAVTGTGRLLTVLGEF